jgi:hypothetical protein
MRRSGPRVLVALLLAFSLAPLTPQAAAAHTSPANVGLGVDAKGLAEAATVSAVPDYVSFWAGKWTATYGWGGLESALAAAHAKDATLVVLWFYWGNDISPECFASGCNGKSREEWSRMSAELARVVKDKAGGREVLVVLEPEFNKQSVTTSAYAPTLDAYLAAEATRLKTTPGIKVVVGYGLWDLDLWGRIPKTLAASDALGFQSMRASTRHNESAYRGVANDILAGAKRAHALAPEKPVVLFDLALATYSPTGSQFWERVQSETLSSILSKRPQYAAYGLSAILYRATRDDPKADQSDYFGPAEPTFGLKRADGAPKAGWNAWVKGMGGAPAAWVPFSGVKGNEWWIEARVEGKPARVEARVDGGAWATMTERSWGAHAVSTRAPDGSAVELRATYGNGTVARAGYAWPSATPTDGAAAFDARFSNVKLYEWWVQVDVQSASGVARVDARIDGGAACSEAPTNGCSSSAWVPLEKQSWGAWAKSLRVPAGAKVEFRATSASGATVVSGAYSR